MSIHYLLFSFLFYAASCQSNSSFITHVAWQQSSVSTLSQTVATQTNIAWAFATAYLFKKNDCIVFEFPNPFIDSTYQTFSRTGPTPCTLNSLQKVACSIDSPQKFKITFMDDSSDHLLKGQTTQTPFQTPLSARKMQSFTVSLFSGCDQTQPAAVTGRTSNQIEFNPQELKPSQVQITSSSQVIGAINNTLTLILSPSQNLPKAGKIIIQAPQWYMTASTKQGYQKNQMSPDNMFDLDSVASLISGGDGLMFKNSTFSMTSGTITINYQNSQVSWRSNISIQVSNFKNPINRVQKSGFQISLTDSMSVLCATTGQNTIQLQTLMVASQPLTEFGMQFLGDEDGNHVAQVGFKNSLYLQMTSPIPLEPFCIVRIQMPKQFQIEEITKITGDGFFKSDGAQLTPNLYILDRTLNTLTIQACLLPNNMSRSPSGYLTISSVQLPSYQQQSDPIQIQIFANNFMTDAVVENPNGPVLQAEEMIPGKIEMVQFQPTDPRAFAKNVNYQISVILQSGFLSSQKMTVKLPKGLKFSNDCQVELRPGTCQIDNSTNTVVLTNMTSIDQQPDSIVSFTIYNGDNPNRSQQVGVWSLVTQILSEGEWYVQDAGNFAFSFKTLAGKLDSELNIDFKQTYSIGSTYSFSSTTQHEIPVAGFLMVQLPLDCALSDKVTVLGLTLYSQNQTTSQILLSIPSGAKKETKINYTISGIRNPRSFAPSDPFIISSLDSEQFVVDQGLDVNVQMQEMNFFDSITYKPLNPTNGFVGTYVVQFNSSVEIKNGDMLHFTLPSEMSAVAGGISCASDNSTQTNNVVNVTCQSTGQEVLVNYDQISQGFGFFGIILTGIKNPPSFRKSNLIFNVALKTKDNWSIQQVQNSSKLFVQTTITANITNYTQDQSSEQYGEDSTLTLSFRPLNPFTFSTLITINWSASAGLYNDTECQITTSKVQTLKSSCVIDLKNRNITIQGIFDKIYSGTIKIFLSRVRNPMTNKNLKPWLLQTYDNAQYPSDMLMFYSLTECDYTCHYCGTDKSYCTECWPGDINTMLMRTGSTSTCQQKCNSGWTSNGNMNSTGKLCVACDSSCLSCYDKGNVGDYKMCSKCSPGFSYFDPPTRACMKQCAIGQYDLGELLLGNSQCGNCNNNCLSCKNSPNNCISCKQNSNKTALFESQCLEMCPVGFGNKGGVCVPCQSPCKTCSWDSDVCTSCDNSLNRTFSFGHQCVEYCPSGTLTNDTAKKCIGCNTGCKNCNETDQSYCLECDNPLYILEGACLNQCPAGFASEFEEKVCFALESLDIKLVYFPFILLMIVIGGVSWIGRWVKPKHKIFANFVVMMGFLEHISLITQVALCFAYGGTIAFALVSILIWLSYFAGQFIFQHFFNQDITQDKLLQAWMNDKRNQVAQKIFKILGYITWKCYKLLYSHYFGYQVKTTDFSNPELFQKLMFKMTLANIITVYCPLIVLNIAGLLTSVWGTQLYVMFIENIVLSAVMIAVSLYEQTNLPTYMDGEHTRRANYTLHMKPIMAFSDFQDEVTKEQQQLLKNVVKKGGFAQMEFEQLIELFGERKCQSMQAFDRQNEMDPRKIRSYPMSPGLSTKTKVKVANPPIPIWPIMPNNCIGIPQDALMSLNGTGRNRACQAGSFGNDLKRNDADLISTNLLPVATVDYSSNFKKQRGRKNRFNVQIDTEDHIQALRAERQYGHLSVQDDPVYNLDITDDLKAEIDEKIQGERLLAALEAMRTEDEAFTKEFSMRFQLSEQEVARQSGLELTTGRHSNLQKSRPDITPGRITDLSRILPKESQLDLPSFKKPQKIYPVEVIVPDSSERMFNENQIFGEILRDVNGLKIIDVTANGCFIDLKHRSVTRQGYLLNQNGQVVSNADPKTVMFTDLVDGELPAPFCFEKFNFSPWEIIGQFDYSNTSDPSSFFKAEAGELLDLKDRKINLQGFLIGEQGDLVKYNGETVIQKSQLESGLLPLLYNYDGVCFSIIDVMGVLEVFEGKSLFQKSQAAFKDKTGHLVNEKGYLVTKEGSVCTRNGQILFKKEHLKFGDFPKIFAFSDFDKTKFQGKFKLDKSGQPVRDHQGNLKDKENRLVNQSGYLVDKFGNVVDRGGNVFLDHSLMDSQGELPLVFLIVQNNTLDADQKIVDNIEADQTIVDHVEETSYGSEMAEPIKFDYQNQELSEVQEQSARRRRRKHKSKDGMVKIKKYFEADIKMAGAYGGVAKPRERLMPERLVSQRFATVARERPKQLPPKIQNLTQSITQQEVPQTAKNIESKRTGILSSTDDAVGNQNSTAHARQSEHNRRQSLKLNRVQPTHFKEKAMTINSQGDYGNSRNHSHRKNDYDGLQYESPSSQFSLSSGGPYTLTEADPEKAKKGLQYFQKGQKQKVEHQSIRMDHIKMGDSRSVKRD